MSRNLMMLEKEVIDSLCNKFHFVIEEYKDNSKLFGNEIIILKSDFIRIRFATDKGDINIEVSKINSENWYSVENILELVGAYKNITPNKNIEIKTLNKLILENIDEIKLIFSKKDLDLIDSDLKRIEKEKIKKMFGNDIFL